MRGIRPSALIGMTAALMAGACASRPAPAPEWSGDGVAEQRAVTGEELMPELFGGPMPGPAWYSGVEGGAPIRTRYETDRAADGRVTVKEFAGDAPDPSEVSEFVRTAEGGVALARVTSHDRGTITEFVPPMLVIGATGVPGEQWRQKFALVVRPIDEPTKIRNRGTAEYTLTFSGIERLSLDGEPVEAGAFVEEMNASLSAATVRVVTRHWYALSGPTAGGPSGMIGEHHQEMISVLGLPAERTERELRRER